jgi:hypothetical protein
MPIFVPVTQNLQVTERQGYYAKYYIFEKKHHGAAQRSLKLSVLPGISVGDACDYDDGG